MTSAAPAVELLVRLSFVPTALSARRALTHGMVSSFPYFPTLWGVLVIKRGLFVIKPVTVTCLLFRREPRTGTNLIEPLPPKNTCRKAKLVTVD